MTEVIRTYAVGDSVISTTPLVAPPDEAPGVRLEIPAGCRGTVVGVRDEQCSAPYTVVFDVADGALVEIAVNGGQMARVRPPSDGPVRKTAKFDLPPMQVKEPRRRVNRHALFTPTKQFPSYYCRPLHVLSMGLLVGAYAAILLTNLWWTLFWSTLVALAVYIVHVRSARRWSVTFSDLRSDEPSETETLEVCDHCIPHAVLADFLYVGCLAVSLGCHVARVVLGCDTTADMWLWAVAAFVMWMVRGIFHERAARIVPKETDE